MVQRQRHADADLHAHRHHGAATAGRPSRLSDRLRQRLVHVHGCRRMTLPDSSPSFENRRLARLASQELRELGAGFVWTRDDELKLAEYYQQLDDEDAKEDE